MKISTLSTRSTRAIGVAMACLTVGGTAQASSYTLSGQFGTTVYAGPLNGGSFLGVYDFQLPTVGAFDIVMRDAGNTVRAELTNANSHVNFIQNFGGSGYDALQFVTNGPDSSATILSVDFQAGFSGIGAVVPYPAGFPYASFATLGGQTTLTTSTVVSGFSAPVPEPAAWALFGLGLAFVRGWRLRQRALEA